MKNGNVNIVITGAESTGKSTLTRDLADHYKTIYIPEYARQYVGKINRPYQFKDMEHIAQTQIEELKTFQGKANKCLFVDTYLVITKVWFDVVYGSCPLWIIEQIKRKEIDLYLLCNNDLPWIPDNIRENGGEMREILFNRYIEELEKYNLTYAIVGGKENQRLKNAIDIVDSFLSRQDR